MTKKLLIVEDDELLRQVFEKTFQQHGYTVDTANTGVIAMQKIRTHPYDLILLDVVLPDISGIDVLRTARNADSIAKNTPVFITSNLPQDATVTDAEQLKIEGYLTKATFSPEEMAQKVTDYFTKKVQSVEV